MLRQKQINICYFSASELTMALQSRLNLACKYIVYLEDHFVSTYLQQADEYENWMVSVVMHTTSLICLQIFSIESYIDRYIYISPH